MGSTSPLITGYQGGHDDGHHLVARGEQQMAGTRPSVGVPCVPTTVPEASGRAGHNGQSCSHSLPLAPPRPEIPDRSAVLEH